MATYSTMISDSKMAYAVLQKCVELHHKAYMIRTVGLAQVFPNIDSEWDNIAKILKLGVSSKIAWTGASQTKDDKVPDETRVPHSVEINEAIIRIMKQKAEDFDITLSTSYEFFDETNEFKKAAATWESAVKLYLDIYSLAEELNLYRFMLAYFHRGDSSTERGPAQVMPFMTCDIPLSGEIFVPNLNWEGMESAFGDFYSDVINQPPLETLKAAPLSLTSDRTEVVGYKQDDPDNPGVKTIYTFSESGMIGVITALDSEGTYHTSGITYTSGSAGKLTLDIPESEAPASVTFELHSISAS